MDLGGIQKAAIWTKKTVAKANHLSSLRRHRGFHLDATNQKTLGKVTDVLGLSDFFLNDLVKRILQARHRRCRNGRRINFWRGNGDLWWWEDRGVDLLILDLTKT